MNAERKFWESVLSAASQDWDVQIDASLGSGALSKQDVRVYVVDVTSGWMSAGWRHDAGNGTSGHTSVSPP
jgi:hypothetical protein